MSAGTRPKGKAKKRKARVVTEPTLTDDQGDSEAWTSQMAEELANLRMRLGKLKQGHLAAMLGCHKLTVSHWERNTAVPSGWQRKMIAALAQAVKADFAYQNRSGADYPGARHYYWDFADDDLFAAKRIPLRWHEALTAAFGNGKAEGK